jgi:hypothetical protein
MEIMRYLTREPVSPEDIQLARTRILRPVTPLPMQETSGEELGTREGFSEGTTDFNQKYKKELEIAKFKDWNNLNKKQKTLIYNINRELKSGRDPESFTQIGSRGVSKFFENKYKDVIEEKFNKKQISSDKWDNLSAQERARIASEYLRVSKLKERVVQIKLGNETINLPKGMKFTNFKLAIDSFKKGYSKLLEWKNNPTPEKWLDLFSNYKGNRKFADDLRKYLQGKEVPNQTKNLFDAINIKSKLTPQEIEKINNFDYQLKQLAVEKGAKFAGQTNKQKVADQLNLIKNNKDVLSFIKNQDFTRESRRKIANKIATVLDQNPSIAARRIADLAQAFNGNKDYVNFSTTDENVLKGSKRISDIMKSDIFSDFGANFRRVDYEREVSKQLGQDKSYMTILGQKITKLLPEGFHRDEIKNLASSAKYETGGYSVFMQGILKNINHPLKKPVDAGVQQAERLIRELDPFDSNYETKRNIIKDVYNKKVDNFVKKINVNLKEGELPVRAFKLSFDSPTETVSRFNDLPENVKNNILNTHKNFGYSFEIPKDVMTGEESLKFAKSPEGQSKIKERYERGDRRVLFEGLEPDSPLRKIVGYFPGSAIPLTLFDAVTLPLAGYSIPETATIAAQNLLKNPYIAGAANLVTQGYITAKEATDKSAVDLANERRKALEQGITNIREKFTSFTNEPDTSTFETAMPMKKGGRVKLANGTDESYNPEIPSLGETDPIGILEQRLMNSNDINEIMRLLEVIKLAKEEKAAKEKEREEYKATQKAKGIRYKEDFPSEAAYFAETGKQLLTNPKYFLSKGAKGIVEGTEFLIGQPLQTLFSQTGKNFEFYEPVLGEKLGINKYIEKNIPKGATTGTLVAGDVAEIAGSVADPFLAYGLIKGAMRAPKTKGIPSMEEIDPTRRDILKTGAVMGAGAALYPTVKKLGIFEELTKGTKVATKILPKVPGMPEWFPSLISKIEKEGVDVIRKLEGKDNLVYVKKIEIPVTGKKDPEKIFMTRYPDGTIEINTNIKGGAYDEPFELYYKPPKTRVDEKTGKVIEEPGNFSVIEQRPKPDPNDLGNYEFDYEMVSKNEALSDIEKLESFSTGKVKNLKEAEKRATQRKNYFDSPYDDISNRYPEPDYD